MTGTQHLEPDVHDMIDELTRQHTHRANYSMKRGRESWTQGHVTTVAPLVYLLLGNMPAGSQADAGSSHGRSKPAARIEALDTVAFIDDEAARWVRRLGEDDPGDMLDLATGQHVMGSGTVRCIAKLHGLMAATDHCRRPHGHRHNTRCAEPHHADAGTWCCTWHDIEHHVRRWWRQARIMTGFDWVYRPFNTCPVCEQRGSLRILVELQSGMCVECRSVWSPEDFHRLADHIRDENDTPRVANA